MSGQPAARLGDTIICPVPQATPAALPHAPPPGLPITLLGAPLVMIGGKPAARVGDQSLCVAPVPTPNPILRGAFPVPIMSMPAARLTDSATHPGSIIGPPCCPTVLIGLAGTTGNPPAGMAACQAMAAGRNPAAGSTDSAGNALAANTPGQSYNNCGIETARQVLNTATGSNVSQEALFNSAIANGNASQPAIGSSVSGTTVTAANQAWFSGGTVPSQQASILNNNGVPATTIPATPTGAQLGQYEVAMSQGRAVLAGGDVSGFPGWGTQTGGHAVLITGFEYDDTGTLTNVIYNDTGLGICGQRATAAQFQSAMSTEANNIIANGGTPLGAAVTTNPVW